MQPTGQPAPQSRWQPPTADPVDAQEQAREVIETDPDPESSAGSVDLTTLDLGAASEADLADQLIEVSDDYDDDSQR